MNPIEKRIAQCFQEAGIEYGDVKAPLAERIVELCHIKGLTPNDVIQGKTPQGIAALWMHRCISTHSVPVNVQEDGQSYPLLPFSKLIHDAIGRDREVADIWNFPVLLRTKKTEIDAQRLSEALNAAINNHPVMAMHITADGQQWHEYGYRTPFLSASVYGQDEYVYLSFSINRILGDATSFAIFAQNIWRAYRGEPLPHDVYLHYLQQYQQHTLTAEYAEHIKALKQQYDLPAYPLLPTQDSPQGRLQPTTPHTPYITTPGYDDKLAELSRKEKISTNAAFCLATALAIMDYNGTDKAGLTWAYMGRETKEQMNIFGSLHRDIPMVIVRQDHTSALLTQLREQMEQGIRLSDYPFTLSSPVDSPWHSAVNVLIQPSLADAMEGCPAEFEFIPVPKQSNESYCMLDIDINLEPLTLTFNYSPRHYKRESIVHFAHLIDKNIRILLE